MRVSLWAWSCDLLGFCIRRRKSTDERRLILIFDANFHSTLTLTCICIRRYLIIFISLHTAGPRSVGVDGFLAL